MAVFRWPTFPSMDDPLDSTREPRHEGAYRFSLACSASFPISRSILIRYPSSLSRMWYCRRQFLTKLLETTSLLATFVLDIRCTHSLLYLSHVYRLVTELWAWWWDKSNVPKIFDRYFCFYEFDISKRIILKICLNMHRIIHRKTN